MKKEMTNILQMTQQSMQKILANLKKNTKLRNKSRSFARLKVNIQKSIVFPQQ